MNQNRLLMETTEVPAVKTVGEITAALISAGATQIATNYQAGRLSGLSWVMHLPGQGDRLFEMPARVEPVYKILISRRRDRYKADVQASVREQAARVAWRQLLRWVQAQIAMIETDMVDVAEVFFPYMQLATGTSIYQAFKEHGPKLLPAPGKEN